MHGGVGSSEMKNSVVFFLMMVFVKNVSVGRGRVRLCVVFG